MRPLKRLGQHFLKDPRVIFEIVAQIEALKQPGDQLLEIGPGHGALTHPLLKKNERLSLIEFDARLIAPLRRLEHCSLYHEDVLTFDFNKLGGGRWCVVGNLPYNISVPTVVRLLQSSLSISALVIMVQKEVAQRLVAAPGSRSYGRLSVLAQYYCEVQRCFDVSPEAFNPAPGVTSTVVQLIPRSRPPQREATALVHLCRLLFSKRRKQLHHALSTLRFSAPLEALGVDLTARVEQLSVAQLCGLAHQLQGESDPGQ